LALRKEDHGVEIGLSIPRTLPYAQQAELATEAARLGFDYVTTNETPGQTDAFQVCLLRWLATRDVVPGGMTNVISVVPAGMRNPVGLAMSAMTLSQISGGKIIVGLGTGRAYREAYRRMWGIPHRSMLRLMRDTLTATRALTRGETVTYDSLHFQLDGARVHVQAPPPPLFLAALGPEMVKLGGELADGLALNACPPAYLPTVRAQVADGAARAGRAPSGVKLMQVVRLVIDDDVMAARRTLVRGLMSGAPIQEPGPRGEPLGYRAHYLNQGFTREVADVDAQRARGLSDLEQLDHYPEPLVRGYYGRADGAVAAFQRLAAGLDMATLNIGTTGASDIHGTKELLQRFPPAVLLG
jgi:alkanesulfonate monooxygenase SsuD/methylene tetrahydromethanopterin reductase-like flavin-dependent oxidoreductase (luciferase family)